MCKTPYKLPTKMQNTNKNNENVQTHVDMYSGHNIIYTDDLEKCYISYLDT